MTTIRWTMAAGLAVTLAACGGETADADAAATETADAPAATAPAEPITAEEAERIIVANYIDGEEELVSIDLEQVDENEFAGEMRWTHPVGGDLTADCTATMERGEDREPYALFSTCQVRE